MMRLQPEAPGSGFLEVFPTEITILIISHMMQDSRKSLSRCSVLCYQLCFPFRFKPKAQLTPDSIGLFQDGGLCAPIRRNIRYLHFEYLKFFSHITEKPNDSCISSTTGEFDFESFVTQFRTLASLLACFPNVRELKIYCDIPAFCELNVYAAILRIIADQNHDICRTLRHFKFVIHRSSLSCPKVPYAWVLQWESWILYGDKNIATPEWYSYFFSMLSRENQNFLGDEITPSEGHSDELTEMASRLSSLGAVVISTYKSSNSPDDRFGILERSKFYYTSLAKAPQLDTFHIKNKVLREVQDRKEACQMDQRNMNEDPHTDFKVGSSLIEYVNIMHSRSRIGEHEIQLRLPLTIPPPDPFPSKPRFEPIDCGMPQSAYRQRKSGDLARSASPEQLKLWMSDLLQKGFTRLDTVTVGGVRSHPHDLVRTVFILQKGEESHKVKIRGTTTEDTAPWRSCTDLADTDLDLFLNGDYLGYMGHIIIFWGFFVTVISLVASLMEARVEEITRRP